MFDKLDKDLLNTYYNEYKEYKDKLHYAEYKLDHTSQVIDAINMFVYSGLIGTNKEYVLVNFRYKPEDLHRFDGTLDSMHRVIYGIEEDIKIHEEYIAIYNDCDKLVNTELPIDVVLSQEIVDKCKKLLQSIPDV